MKSPPYTAFNKVFVITVTDVDETAPVVTVTSPSNITASNVGVYPVAGTCTVNDGNVTIMLGTAPNTVTTTTPCGADGKYSTTVNVSSLPEGSVAIQVSQTDAAGNTGTANTTVTKATTTPTITVTNPDTTPALTKTVSATASSGSNITGYAIVNASTPCDANVTYTSGSSVTLSSESDNGKKVCFRAADTHGNLGYQASAVIGGIDTTPPTATITASTTNPTNQDVTLTLTANEAIWTPTGWTEVTGSNGTEFTRTVTTNGVVSVSLTDVAGNVQTTPVTYNVTNIDKTKPTLAGNTSVSMTVGSAGAVAFDPVSGITVTDNVDTNLTPTCTTTPVYNGSIVGSYTVTCTATDTAGNISDTFTRSVTITSIDKTPLQSAITSAQAALNNPSVINDAQKAALEGKITEAQAAMSNPNLTETQRDALIAELQTAIDALVRDTEAPVFTPAHPAPIVMRKGHDITTLVNGVAANDVLSGLNTQGITHNATTLGLDLVNPASGDYSLVYTATDNKNNTATLTRNVAITNADALIAKIVTANDPATIQGKTPASIAHLETVKVHVQSVVDDIHAPQSAIDQALADLIAAINALENIATNPTSPTNPTHPTPGPGGSGGGESGNTPVVITPVPNTSGHNTPLPHTAVQGTLPSQNTLTPNGTTPSGQKVFNLENRITDFICPQVVQAYDYSDLVVRDNPTSGVFHDDIAALMMFRGLEKDEMNLGQTYEEYKKYGVVLNVTHFELNRNVTRAEYVKMLVRSLSCRYTFMGTDTGFNDVDQNQWYAEYIKFAVENKWINGYSDGSFRPNAPITRDEAAKILSIAIQLTTNGQVTTQGSSFSDVASTSEFIPHIETLKDKGIMKGRTDTTFAPKQYIPRTEASRVIYRTFFGGGK